MTLVWKFPDNQYGQWTVVVEVSREGGGGGVRSNST